MRLDKNKGRVSPGLDSTRLSIKLENRLKLDKTQVEVTRYKPYPVDTPNNK